MSVFDARQVAAEKAGSLFDVALRHAFLEPVVADGLADIHGREHDRMGHSNQISIFWQVGNSCHEPDRSAIRNLHQRWTKIIVAYTVYKQYRRHFFSVR